MGDWALKKFLWESSFAMLPEFSSRSFLYELDELEQSRPQLPEHIELEEYEAWP